MSFAKTATAALASIALASAPVVASAQVQTFPDGSYLGTDGKMHNMPDSMPRPTTAPPHEGMSNVCPPTKQDGRLPFLANCHWAYLTPPEAQTATTQVSVTEPSGPMCTPDSTDPAFGYCSAGLRPADDRYIFVEAVATPNGPMDLYHFGKLPKDRSGWVLGGILFAAVACLALCPNGNRNGGSRRSGPGFSADRAPSVCSFFGDYRRNGGRPNC